MECDDNGRERVPPAASGSRGVQRVRVVGSRRGLQLAYPAATCSARAGRPSRALEPDTSAAITATPGHPFMSNMDEISYWVYTKRAPCLFNYDNVLKKQVEQAHCSKATPVSGQSIIEEVPASNKKKRKIKLIDDDSILSEKPQNVYFETPQNQNQKTAQSSCKSDTIGSNIEFNIKKSSVQNKSKRIKLQKNNQAHKKNKVVTSTPKVTNLRRSLRKAQQQNRNGELSSSFDIYNEKEDAEVQLQNQSQKLDEAHHNKSKTTFPEQDKDTTVQNGQYEDLSDVSGFTANYIRSTKIHSAKTPRKPRNRNSRNIVKNNKVTERADEKIIVCVNKSVNTGLAETNLLNCSTDSSQNVINLVSVKNNSRSSKVNKSTSLLKFMESKLDHTKDNISNNKVDDVPSKTQLNMSFQSKSSGTSRYPTRYRNNTKTSNVDNNLKHSPRQRFSERINKLDDAHRKENSQERITTRTRSRKKVINMDCNPSEVLELNHTRDQSSSGVAMNVANTSHDNMNQGNTSSSRCLRSRRCKDKSVIYKDFFSDGSDGKVVEETNCPLVKTSPRCLGRSKKSSERRARSPGRDRSRNRSGFTACFSDSGSDNEPLKQRKFFC
ncbi:hypothetical protein KGM_202766 [Danaus plexippus plexippus]|uniref:Uncharacterized protein n=1 Tax=Danaus plexippus plexippus TaxID=278856 RepID=A0A212F218_DANPL|nr:hypothetical protein KGM_202766 [Danaus plexippus plexippus]